MAPQEITAVEAQKRLGLSPSTFYRKIREYEKQIGKGKNMIWYVLGFLLTAAVLLIGGMDYAVK